MKELTVKVGDTVYITRWWKKSILVGTVESLHEDNSFRVAGLYSYFTPKNAFLSKEKAEEVVERLVEKEIELVKKRFKTNLAKLEKFKHKFEPV